jgi:electron transport complex protein RnfC
MKPDRCLRLSQEEMTIVDAPEPAEVLIPLNKSSSDSNRLRLKAGDHLITGNEILPGLFSPVSGTIINIEPLIMRDREVSSLRIKLDEKDEQDPEIKAEPDFLKMNPGEMVKILNRANLGFNESLESLDTVIVSIVDQDPLSMVQQQLWRENKFLTLEGLRLIKHLLSARKIIFAIPLNLSESGAEIPADVAEIFLVKPQYPMGLPEVLIADISRSVDLGKCGFINVEKLIAAVVALKEGKPFVHKVITVVGKEWKKNLRIRIGTRIKDIFKDNELHDDDKLILGSPLRGETVYHTDIPVGDDIDLICLQDSSQVILNENRPCMSCGKCVRVCPVQLDVNLICRFSEFSLFENCRELDVFDCIECGLCAYNCPSRRSLVQFIKLAKSELQKIKEEVES